MRKSGILLTAMLALVTMPIMVKAQVCGDANNNGTVNISDVAYLIDYLGFGQPPSNPAMADCDGRAGITISDDVAIMNYIFAGGFRNCNATGVYSSNYTIGDSIFWPRMLDIPDGVDSVSLPVSVLLEPDAQGYYIPFLNQGVGGNSVFQLNRVTHATGQMIAYASRNGDTTILITSHYETVPYWGVNTIFTLNYVRISPGIGNIAPELIDRTLNWFPSFERNSDLFRFAVSPRQLYLPVETLLTTPTQLSYASQAGKVAPDSFVVSFTSTSVAIDFNIVSPEPWIILKDVPFSGFTTPASVWVKADATALPIGDYTGSIIMTPNDTSITATPQSVTVTFHVTPPIVYPPGDFNCDGICDLSDLSAIISYMTGGSNILKHCNQF